MQRLDSTLDMLIPSGEKSAPDHKYVVSRHSPEVSEAWPRHFKSDGLEVTWTWYVVLDVRLVSERTECGAARGVLN